MRALLLEGGGGKGAYQAGAIMAFNKKKIYFDIVGGTSIGAINAAFYVTKNFKGLLNLWLKTDSEDLFNIKSEFISDLQDFNINKEEIKYGLSSVHDILKSRGIDTSNIRKILEKNINEKKFRKSKIDYGLNTFNLSDKKEEKFFKKDIPNDKLIDYVLSSAYLPFFKLERIIDDKYYLDGGIANNCPVDMFVDYGCDEIYVVKAWQKKIKFKNSKNAKVHIIVPNENLGSIVLFNTEISKYRMKLGYYDTIKYLDNLDGNKYYFKNYNNEYYNNLFDQDEYIEMTKIYGKGKKYISNKSFIIDILERICETQKIERFKIYNIPFLITKLKYILSKKKNSRYYEFIKKIKVDFN